VITVFRKLAALFKQRRNRRRRRRDNTIYPMF
jgi:hypothetical protein